MYPKIYNKFCKILVIDIPKYISLSSLNYKKFCEKRFLLHKVIRKNDFGSCQQVVMINLSAIKSHVKKPKSCIIIFQNLPIVSKYSQKNHPTANRCIYICPIFPNTCCLFSTQFWVTAALFAFDPPSFHKMYLSILRRHDIKEDSP